MPPGRGRRVGEDLAVAVARRSSARARSPRSRRGPRARSEPPRARQPVAHRRRDVAAVERLGALARRAAAARRPARGCAAARPRAARARRAPTAPRTPASRSAGRRGSPRRRPARRSARRPSRASCAAGAASSSSGIVPQRSIASHTPAGVPYTPQEAGPMWNTCSASPKDTSIACSSAARPPSRRPRAAWAPATKKSSSAGSLPPAGDEHVAAGAEPRQQRLGTNDVSIAATAASTALPPSRSTRAPASRRQRMPGRDDSLLSSRSLQSDSTAWRATSVRDAPALDQRFGMNSGTSSSSTARPPRRGARRPGRAARRCAATLSSPRGLVQAADALAPALARRSRWRRR